MKHKEVHVSYVWSFDPKINRICNWTVVLVMVLFVLGFAYVYWRYLLP